MSFRASSRLPLNCPPNFSTTSSWKLVDHHRIRSLREWRLMAIKSCFERYSSNLCNWPFVKFAQGLFPDPKRSATFAYNPSEWPAASFLSLLFLVFFGLLLRRRSASAGRTDDDVGADDGLEGGVGGSCWFRLVMYSQTQTWAMPADQRRTVYYTYTATL